MYSLLTPCIENTCHCNFLYNIHNCKESKELKVIMIAGLIIAIINSIGGSAIVIRRRYFQSQKLFDNKRMSGFPLKPRPIDSIFFFSTIFSTLWVIDFIILLTNAFPTFIILRSFFFNFPLQLSTHTCVLYILSILQQFSQTRIQFPKIWYIPTLSWLEYYCGIVLLIIPFILHNILCIFIGLLLSSSSSPSLHNVDYNNRLARLLTRVHFGLWSFILCSLFMIYLYCVYRLHQLYPTSNNNKNIIAQTSFYRNRLFLMVLTICIGLFVLLFFFYSLFIDTILFSSWSILFYGATWIYFPLFTQFTLIVIFILNPKIIIQSMLKIKGIEKDQSQSIDQSTDQEEKEIVTFVSHAPSSIQLSSSIDYDSLHKLYKTYNTNDYNDNDNHSDINMTDNININIQQKKKKVSLSSSLSSYTLYSPPSLPPPLHLYQTNSISTSFSDFSNKTLY